MNNTQDHESGTNGKTMDSKVLQGIATKTVNQLEDQALRGAAAVSQMAHKAADQIDRTTDYVQKATRWTLDNAQDQSTKIKESFNRNPVPMILGAAAIACPALGGVRHYPRSQAWAGGPLVLEAIQLRTIRDGTT